MLRKNTHQYTALYELYKKFADFVRSWLAMPTPARGMIRKTTPRSDNGSDTPPHGLNKRTSVGSPFWPALAIEIPPADIYEEKSGKLLQHRPRGSARWVRYSRWHGGTWYSTFTLTYVRGVPLHAHLFDGVHQVVHQDPHCVFSHFHGWRRRRRQYDSLYVVHHVAALGIAVREDR